MAVLVKTINGEEYEALRPARQHVLKFRRGERKRIKRNFNRRVRRDGKLEAKADD